MSTRRTQRKHKRSGHKRSRHKRSRHKRRELKKSYRKGSKSKTMKGKKDFTTKKTSKVFNRRKHYQKHAKGSRVIRRPYHNRGGATHASKHVRLSPAVIKKADLTVVKGPLKSMFAGLSYQDANLANLQTPRQEPTDKKNVLGQVIMKSSFNCDGKTWCSLDSQIKEDGLAGNTPAQAQ